MHTHHEVYLKLLSQPFLSHPTPGEAFQGELFKNNSPPLQFIQRMKQWIAASVSAVVKRCKRSSQQNVSNPTSISITRI